MYRSNETVVSVVMFCFEECMLDGLPHIFHPHFSFCLTEFLQLLQLGRFTGRLIFKE